MNAGNHPDTDGSGSRSEDHIDQGGTDFQFTEAELRAALNLIARESLKPVVIGSALVYLAASITLYLFPTIVSASVVSAVCAIMAGLLLSLGLALDRWAVAPGLAHPLMVLITTSGCLVCVLIMYLNPEPHHTTSFLLLIVAAGFSLLSTRWLALVIAMAILGWWILVRKAVPSPLWIHYGFALFVATMLALIVHAARIRALRRIETMRIRETRLTERAELMRRITASQEEERRRIARELHDQTGQCVTALKYGLEALKTSLPEAPEAQRQLAQMFEISERLDQEIDQLTYALRPPLLELGLARALEHYLVVWQRQSRIPVEFDGTEWSGRLAEEAETAVYRVTQEALTNVLKHARASRVGVSLKTQWQCLEVVIQDDGCGFDPAAILREPDYQNRLGLLNMRERMVVVGGTCDVESAPGRGTAIHIRVPASAIERGRQNG